MKKHTFLAFDLGATSGRAVVGEVESVKFVMREIHRFPNTLFRLHGKYYWNIYALYEALKASLALCAQQDIRLDSVGIDAWGVDFGYIGADGSLLGLPRAYRDPYTEHAPERFFRHVSREKLYQKTGIQILNFNSLFQLFSAHQNDFAPVRAAEEILFIPDLLSYLLTGVRVCEYTAASTSQLLNPVTKQFDSSLLEAAGVKPTLLRPVVMPGTKIGTLTEEVAAETGVGRIPVIAVAGHDTASAVVAIPAENSNFAYLSSGTWSLMGIETEEPIVSPASFRHNFTNEGGIEGTTRFLKNITGLWLLEQCRKEWEQAGRSYTYPEIVHLAQEAPPFACFVDPDDARFAHPSSMPGAIVSYCEETGQPVPASDGGFVRCIFESLALRYSEVMGFLKKMAPFPIDRLHVIGGGSRNRLLNQFTADATGMPVIAGPSEATALGNCMVQARAAGLVADRWEMRRMIAASVSTETFLPRKTAGWKEAYERYSRIVEKKR